MAQDNAGQTQMTNPPKKEVKMVKVKALHPIRIKDPADPKQDLTVNPGTIVEMTEAEAKEFEKPIAGVYNFSGERYHADGDTSRAKIVRVQRVS